VKYKLDKKLHEEKKAKEKAEFEANEKQEELDKNKKLKEIVRTPTPFVNANEDEIVEFPEEITKETNSLPVEETKLIQEPHIEPLEESLTKPIEEPPVKI